MEGSKSSDDGLEAITSRMDARSTNAATPVKSCKTTRPG